VVSMRLARERLACLSVAMSRMRGVVRLPFAVLFSEDALGSSLSGTTDRFAFTLSLPRLPADADEARFLLESPKNESWPCTETLGGMAWGYLGFEGRPNGRRILASWVNRVAIEIETYDRTANRGKWRPHLGRGSISGTEIGLNGSASALDRPPP
jgi:hypothetical protein